MTKKKFSPYLNNFDFVGAGSGIAYVLPIASGSVLGGIKIGSRLTIDANGVLSADEQPGTTDEKVKYDAGDPTAGYVVDKFVAGTGISVAEGTGGDENKLKITNSAPDQIVAITAGTNITSVTGTYPNFTVNADTQPGTYTLPVATASALGGVKKGDRISIDANGVISADVQSGSGDVMGPATNTDSYIPQRDGANSKTLKDGLAVPAGGLAGLTSPSFTTPDINVATADSVQAGTTSSGFLVKNNEGTTVASFGVGSASSTNIDLIGATTVTGNISATNLSGTNTGDNAANSNAGLVHTAGAETITGAKTFNSDITVPDEAYGAGWDNSLEVPTKNALYDKIQTLGGASTVIEETPSGTINGSNTGFTLSVAPVSGGLSLFRNGVMQTAGAGADYTLSGTSITFNVAPLTGDRLTAKIITAISTTPSIATGAEVDTGTDNAKYVTAKAIADSKLSFTDGTETLTNKRINSRVVSATSYTTDTGTALNVANCDIFIVTAQAGALKFNNPGGTPTQGQKLIIRIKDNGTARALTYDTQFRAMGVALPSTTVLSKTLYLGFIYNDTDIKRDLLAVGQES